MREDKFSAAGDYICDVGPRTTIYPPRNLVSVQIVIMGIFGHIIIITYNPSWHHHLLVVIQIIL